MKTKTLKDRITEIREIYGFCTIIDELKYQIEEARQTAWAQERDITASKLFVLEKFLEKAILEAMGEPDETTLRDLGWYDLHPEADPVNDDAESLQKGCRKNNLAANNQNW